MSGVFSPLIHAIAWWCDIVLLHQLSASYFLSKVLILLNTLKFLKILCSNLKKSLRIFLRCILKLLQCSKTVPSPHFPRNNQKFLSGEQKLYKMYTHKIQIIIINRHRSKPFIVSFIIEYHRLYLALHPIGIKMCV